MRWNRVSKCVVTAMIAGLIGIGSMRANHAQTGLALVKAEEKPLAPLYQTLFLKPGESQDLIFSSVGALKGNAGLGPGIATGDRTFYYFTPVTASGETCPGLKGLTAGEAQDHDRMGKLMERHNTRCVALRFSAAKNAEEGMILMKVLAKGFGTPANYVTIIKVVVDNK